MNSGLTDQIIAAQALNIVKSSMKNIAIALTETATPEVRKSLVKHFQDTVSGHEKITNLMIEKGWYQAYDMTSQIKMDLQNATTTMQQTLQ